MPAQPTSNAPAALTSNLNIFDLPAELWVHEIIARVDYHSLKKTEVLCQALKSYIHSHHSLRAQLFRERVDKKGLNKLYEELEEEARWDSKMELHPAFKEDCTLLYWIVSETDDSITTDLNVFAFGTEPGEPKVIHFEEKANFLLQDHPIANECFTNPPVSFFRFDFEKEGKVHRGTSSRYPSTSNSPKAVTVMDVMSNWVKLLGEKKIASWYDARSKRKPTKILPVRSSSYSPSPDLDFRLVKVGNSVGIEPLDWSLDW